MGFSGKDSQQIIKMLQKTPLFSSLDEKHLAKVLDSAKERRYGSGETIVKEGASGVGFFMIIEGAAEVRTKEKVLSKLGPSQYFGEMTLLDAQPRSADVVATAPTRCLVLSTMNFSSLLATNPRMAEQLIKELARRLRATNKALSE